MLSSAKKNITILFIGLFLTIIFLFFKSSIPPAKFLHLKIYDTLNKIEYKLRKIPPKIKDIVIVGIDNETIGKLPYRWPYPRSVFANTIKNLIKAQAKVIAFDFVFLGKSEDTEDQILETVLVNNNKIILASTIDETGSINIRSLSKLGAKTPSGIVTKIQDMDGIIRKNLTYMISDEVPPRGFLSWEMAIIKASEGLSLTPVKGNECLISIINDKFEKWFIPVDRNNKSFIINFRAHTGDFTRLSFYDAYKGTFDPNVAKDKIVLIGFVSSLLGDIHNSPIGWMPGITLNANSLLTLYTRSFIRFMPSGIEHFLTLMGVIVSIMLILLLDMRAAYIFISIEILIFFAASYILLTTGYVWNYFSFPFCVGIIPALSRKIYTIIWERKKVYWT